MAGSYLMFPAPPEEVSYNEVRTIRVLFPLDTV